MPTVTVSYKDSDIDNAILSINGLDHNGVIIEGIGTETVDIPFHCDDESVRQVWNNAIADVYPEADQNGNHEISLAGTDIKLHTKFLGPLIDALTDYFFETDLAALCK